MLLKPDEIDQLPREIVGGKAWGLAKLASVAHVPNFRVIVPDRELKSDVARLQREFAKGSSTYAVRSSAAAEDSESASYAGLFLTLLATKVPDLPEAIERVVESAQALRVKEFQKAIGASASEAPKIAVVIQEMIDASASGVALSFAPNTERRCALIEAIFGLGEPLVGGKIPPDSWTIDRTSRTIVNYRAGHQVWKQSVGGQELVPSFDRNAPKLGSTQVAAVIDLLLKVERIPSLTFVDLEFCLDGDELYALQARPLLSS